MTFAPDPAVMAPHLGWTVQNRHQTSLDPAPHAGPGTAAVPMAPSAPRRSRTLKAFLSAKAAGTQA